MNVLPAMSVVMGSGLMVDSSSEKASPGELPKAGSLEALSNWRFVRGAKPYGLNRLIGADATYCHLCEDIICIFWSLF